MLSTSDTIVGVATPPGRGGLGVVRLSGTEAHHIALRLLVRDRPLQPRRATFARVSTADHGGPRPIDDVVATYFPGPRSYTAEDVVEIAAHGSPVILDALVRGAMACGARLAERGEFTFRAFVHGRIDLAQAEAVADLIDAVTPRQAAAAYEQLGGSLSALIRPIGERLFSLVARLEASLDFPEEGYRFISSSEISEELAGLRTSVGELLADAARGAVLRQGARVTLLGTPNSGKSTLFNRLVGSNRAIVSDEPGTTRDVIGETIDLDGIPVTLFDTAGVRDGAGAVEGEGVARAKAAAAAAEVVLLLMDGSRQIGENDRNLLVEVRTVGRRHVRVRTKSDLPGCWLAAEFGCSVEVSAVEGLGFDELRRELLGALAGPEEASSPRVTSLRHRELLERCERALDRAVDNIRALGERLPEEVLLIELHEAREALDQVTGARTRTDVLEEIFSRFCIGK